MMLLDTLSGCFLPLYGGAVIAMIVIAGMIALIGLILSCLKYAQGTKNGAKLRGIFVCMFSGELLWGIAIIFIFVGPPVIFTILSILRYVLIVICGILILTLTSRRDNESCPNLSMPAKLIVAIFSILSALSRGVLMFVPSIAFYYIMIVCAVCVGLGTILGIVLGVITHNKKSAKFVVDATRVNEVVEAGKVNEANQPLIIH